MIVAIFCAILEVVALIGIGVRKIVIKKKLNTFHEVMRSMGPSDEREFEEFLNSMPEYADLKDRTQQLTVFAIVVMIALAITIGLTAFEINFPSPN